MEEINAEWVCGFFKKNGLENTSKWIAYALKSRMPDFRKDWEYIRSSMRIEIRHYRREYYNYPELKEACFDSILKLLIGAMTAGPDKFRRLTKELIPVVNEILETNRLLDDIAGVAEKLEDRPKFYMLCFYYLILWEGNFRNTRKQLLAMKRLKEGKHVTITETRNVATEEKLEEEKNLRSICPDHLQKEHKNLRNAIAHAHFRYSQEKNEMEFWDIRPKGEYSMKPTGFSYQGFSKYLLDINIFCELSGLLVLLLIALEDIAKRSQA
jgi:hypothetical protein